MGLFYGTTTGKTESVAERIRDEFGSDIVTLHEIGSVENDDLTDDEYECLIIACTTWNIIDFSCKKVAYLGTGDPEGYPDKFMDAMGFWAENIGETVDYWPVDG